MIDAIRNIVIIINNEYFLSIIHLDDRKAYHINHINTFIFNHFQDKCPFSPGTDENSIVFNGIIYVYSIITNITYATNIYGIHSGLDFISIILNTG